MKAPSFPLYVNNWLGSERITEMEPAQEGAYLRLLCHQWNSENQTIPDSDEKLARLSRLDGKWQDLGRVVRECFDPVTELPGRLRNERLYHEWLSKQEWSRKSREGGLKSGETRRRHAMKGGSTTLGTKGEPPLNLESESDLESGKEPSPPTPQGGSSGGPSTPPAKPARKKKVDSTSARVTQNTITMTRIGKWFGRRETTLWTLQEALALETIGTNGGCTSEDMDALEAYYTARLPKDTDYRRRNVITLLNNWQGEIDRAHGWKRSQPRKSNL